MRSSSGPTACTATLTALLAATSLVACGGEAKVAPTTPAPQAQAVAADDEDREPRSVEEAEERIARARAELEGRPTPGAQSSTLQPEAPPAPAESSAGAARQERKAGEDACARPCRALASMKRAVESLCRMTGDDDQRCVEARRTLAESTTRTASCGCDGG